jgi:hypothetical protein
MALLLAASVAAGCTKSAMAQKLIVGMNLTNAGALPVAQQDAMIAQMKAAGVKVVRFGVSADAPGMDLLRRIDAAGMKIDLEVGWVYPRDAPRRKWQPDKYPGMWSEAPLSYADVAQSRASYQALLDLLDQNHIVPVAFEMGNEINWTAFNGEFPLPGKGIIFNYEQLSSDPEGRQIARGYVRYVELLKAFREMRNRSKLNRETPLISAGLSDPGAAHIGQPGGKDAVTIMATIQFLRAHGADQYVEGYGIHLYPWQGTAQQRKAALQNNGVAACGNGAPGQARPCWITEWGLNNKDMSCPLNDSARAALARETIGNYRDLARQGRVVAAIYFDWGTEKSPGASSVYRCGAATATAKVALTP